MPAGERGGSERACVPLSILQLGVSGTGRGVELVGSQPAVAHPGLEDGVHPATAVLRAGSMGA